MKYAGIGSRKTPPHVLNTMGWIANTLAAKNYTLRSGAANGADTAFELGCDSVNGAKEIYLPWRGFNTNPSKLYWHPPAAVTIAAMVYPFGWNGLSQPVKSLMTRNCMQILGMTLDDPVKFVICWTPDGCESDETRIKSTGGTGQAISLASLLDIPIFNLANPTSFERLNNLLETL